MNTEFLAGAAVADITPTHATHFHLTGMPRLEKTRGVLHSLRAEALCLSLDGPPVWLVTCDQLFMFDSVAKRVRERVGEALAASLGGEMPRILFSVTHSHSAEYNMPAKPSPALVQAAAEDAAIREDGLVRACLDAYAAREPAETAAAPLRLQGPVGVCRRMLQVNGTCMDNWNADAPFIPGERWFGLETAAPDRMDLLALRARGDGRLLALLTSYSSHIHLIPIPWVHGEFAGFAKRELEQRFPGAIALYANGTPGDIQLHKTFPPPPGGDVDAETQWQVDQMQARALTFADAVSEALPQLEFAVPPALGYAEYREDTPELAAEFTHWIRPGIFLQAVAVGNAAVLNLQGELFHDLGRELLSESPFPCQLQLGYHEGGYGYIGHPLSYEQGSYEIKGLLPRDDRDAEFLREKGIILIPPPRLRAARKTLDKALELLRGLATDA